MMPFRRLEWCPAVGGGENESHEGSIGEGDESSESHDIVLIFGIGLYFTALSIAHLDHVYFCQSFLSEGGSESGSVALLGCHSLNDLS